MTDHQNEERTVRCPVEGCDATPLARGVNLHVNRSSGNGHGPQGEVPPDISFENLETVGARKVEMDYPDERDNEKHARLCPYCNQTFVGEQGVMIHLGQTAGRKNHPESAGEHHTVDDFPRVEVDEQGNITSVIDGTEDINIVEDRMMVPARAVYTLVAEFVAEDDMVTAHRLRKHLLGVDNPTRPLRTAPTDQKLFSALLGRGYDEETGQQVSSTVRKDGIMIACRGESALYSADEALDLAAALERTASREDWQGEIPNFINFLRNGADVLDGEKRGGELPKEFDH